MHGDRNLVLADRFDRRVKHDLAAADGDTIALKRGNNVAHRNRSEQLAGLGCLTQHHDVAAIDLLRNLGGLAFGLEVARF